MDNLLARGGNWFTPRSLGSSSTITDSSGNWLQRYDYAPFGQVNVSVGTGPAQPFQFTGREADETGLMYYRARYYNPSWGRFVSEDPIGFQGGINPYVYWDNNPLNRVDPSGLVAMWPILHPPLYVVQDWLHGFGAWLLGTLVPFPPLLGGNPRIEIPRTDAQATIDDFLQGRPTRPIRGGRGSGDIVGEITGRGAKFRRFEAATPAGMECGSLCHAA